MLDLMKPPPMPKSAANADGWLFPAARRPSTASPSVSWMQRPVTGGRPVNDKRKETT